MYVPLFCKSNYSFLEGASHPRELVSRAADLGLPAMALTDRDGLYGVVRAHKAAKEASIKLIIGAEVSVDDGSSIVLLAQNRQGYAHLSALLTKGQRHLPKGQSQVSWSMIADHAPGLIALWGGSCSALVERQSPDATADLLRQAFDDRLYALVPRHLQEREEARQNLLLARVERYGLPPVAAIEVLYHHRDRRPLQDVLTCIDHGVTLDEASTLLRPNDAHALIHPDEMARRYAGHPAMLERTLEIADRCHLDLDDLRYHYPTGHIPDGYDADGWLREQTLRGARKRYGSSLPGSVRDQLVREFSVIQDLGYAGYFLTMKEIVDACQERGILCQGRGSAANSMVCYCLGITAVDPDEMDLLFERFISRERAEPPDIDLDISHERREEILQFVYDHYGRDRAAMVANVIRYRPKSAVRDVGKALGIDPNAIEGLTQMLSRSGELSDEHWTRADLDPSTPRHQHLQRLVAQLLDTPRHLSIHPGGFLLTQGAITDLVPVEPASMDDRTVIQWDKYDVEAMGLFKVDLLGLGALTQLSIAFELLRRHKSIDLSMARLPIDDPATYDLICEADTLGTFQIESRAQMAMLPRLRPRRYYDLVIQISIVRPGPITGDMVHPYLRRRQGKEPVQYPHPALEPVLKKTLGVPLFQEQVMKLAIVAADYTPGEADQLRRDMGAWKAHGRLERHRHRLISRMLHKGIRQEFAERIFHQICGFADYGFPESHAASFALIAYATAYLRCHHPVVFSCSLLNAQPMGFYSPASIIEDARRRGIEVRPLHIHHSQRDCTLEPLDEDAGLSDEPPLGDHALRIGWRYLKGMQDRSIERLLEARRQRPFDDLDDFLERCPLPIDDLRRLAESGALEPFDLTRRQALWRIEGHQSTRDAPLSLPIHDADADMMPALRRLSQLETIRWDYRTSYHSARGHPLAPLRPILNRLRLPTAEQINDLPDGHRVDFAALVICRQRPSTASGVIFMTLEDETGLANLVVFPPVADRYPVILRTASFLGVSGRIQRQDNVVHLLADRLWRPRLPDDPASTKSRDFH